MMMVLDPRIPSDNIVVGFGTSEEVVGVLDDSSDASAPDAYGPSVANRLYLILHCFGSCGFSEM